MTSKDTEPHVCSHKRHPLLVPADIEEHLAKLSGWSMSDTRLTKHYHFEDPTTAMVFVTRVAERAEEINHHPAIHWFKRQVDVELHTKKSGGITMTDFQLAHLCEQSLHGLPLQASNR